MKNKKVLVVGSPGIVDIKGKLSEILNGEIRESGETQCKHEFVTKEYTSQPYGTCLSCGQTIFGLH